MKLMANNINNGSDIATSIQTQQPMKSIGSRWSSFRRRNTDLNDDDKLSSSAAVYDYGPLEFRLPMIIPLNNNDEGYDTNVNVNGREMVTEDIPSMVEDSSEEEDEEVMTGSL